MTTVWHGFWCHCMHVSIISMRLTCARVHLCVISWPKSYLHAMIVSKWHHHLRALATISFTRKWKYFEFLFCRYLFLMCHWYQAMRTAWCNRTLWWRRQNEQMNMIAAQRQAHGCSLFVLCASFIPLFWQKSYAKSLRKWPVLGVTSDLWHLTFAIHIPLVPTIKSSSFDGYNISRGWILVRCAPTMMRHIARCLR